MTPEKSHLTFMSLSSLTRLMGTTELRVKINCDNERLFLKQGAVTLGLRGDMVGGVYFPQAYILPKDIREKDYIKQRHSGDTCIILMNCKGKIGNIKATLCNASNSLAITPDLWVLLPASLSWGVHQLNHQAQCRGMLSLLDTRHRTSTDINPLPVMDHSRLCFFGAHFAHELHLIVTTGIWSISFVFARIIEKPWASKDTFPPRQ